MPTAATVAVAAIRKLALLEVASHFQRSSADTVATMDAANEQAESFAGDDIAWELDSGHMAVEGQRDQERRYIKSVVVKFESAGWFASEEASRIELAKVELVRLLDCSDSLCW